ncbi:MAG: toll/interleukin-1 receptor domain-containing protein [Lysobacterales bacterium]
MNIKCKYKAYISYSHLDEGWAKWLHRALESYRVPRKLVGSTAGGGKVPARIRPVFRDRDDLSSASDLGGTVKRALTDSENMIVVCSPDSAASFWVNEEIRQFASLGRVNRIFCVIVDGQPSGDGAASTCFPPALTEIGLQEPLAADVRKWADGKHLSKLKLVAGMLGLPLDQLRRRDLQKRQRAWALMAVASVAIAAVLVTAITARIAAQQRRVSGESLVSYKLNELRTMLNVSIDPEEVARRGLWNQQDLQKLIDTAGEGEEALINSALDLRKQGIDLHKNGALSEALEKFQQSWALLAENYRRDRQSQSAFFELGQADFYIGQIHSERGDMDKAEYFFMSYAEITRRLILQQPEKAEWVLEMAYALTNLGHLQELRNDDDPERALQFMQSALEYNQIALVLDPQNDYYRSELGQSHAFLADAQRGVCDLEGALQSRQEGVLLERESLAEDPENKVKMKRLAWAVSGLAVVQDELGHVDDAIISIEAAILLMERLLIQGPDDKKNTRWLLILKHRRAMHHAINGGSEQAEQSLELLNEEWQLYFQTAANDDFDAFEAYAAYLIDRAWLAQKMGHSELAERILLNGMTRSVEMLKKLPGNRDAGNLLTLAAFRFWDFKQVLPQESILTLLPYYYSSGGETRACFDVSMAARKAMMLGDKSRAHELTGYLLNSGYAEVTFMQACKAHSYCIGQ